jgi:hypothetical protein
VDNYVVADITTGVADYRREHPRVDAATTMRFHSFVNVLASRTFFAT